MTMFIQVPEYMTALEFQQLLRAQQLLLMHEYKLHGEAAFDRIYPPAPLPADDDDDDEDPFLTDLIEYISKPIRM